MASYEPQQRTMSFSNTPPINLLRGWPHPSLLPIHLIRSAAQEALSDPAVSSQALEYGPDPGYEPLRESVAKWLTSFYHPSSKQDAAVTVERLAITGGASQNLGNILDVYTDPSYTRCVWVVAPAYFLAFRIFEDAGLKMRAVPEDEAGVNISFLRSEMEKVEQKAQEGGPERPKYKHHRSWAKTYKHLIYCVPTFANPSSKTMTLERRKELVMLAREHDALVVCDDIYDFLQWPAKSRSWPSATAPGVLRSAHLPRLVDIDRTLPNSSHLDDDDRFGNTCSNGSLSKIAGPGIRVGWCEGTPAFAYGISQVGTTKSGGAPSQLTSTYVNVMLEKGELQKHIQEMLRPAYAKRYKELMDAVKKWLFPLGFQLPERNGEMAEVAGGYFTWLVLPPALTSQRHLCLPGPQSGTPAEALAERCLADESVVVAPGTIFEVPSDNSHDDEQDPKVSFGDCIRLCWSWEDEARLVEGVEKIARVAQAMGREFGKAGDESGLSKGYVMVDRRKKQDSSRRRDLSGFA